MVDTSFVWLVISFVEFGRFRAFSSLSSSMDPSEKCWAGQHIMAFALSLGPHVIHSISEKKKRKTHLAINRTSSDEDFFGFCLLQFAFQTF